MALAACVLNQNHFPRSDNAALAVTRSESHPGIEVDDILTARRRMPVEIVIGNSLTENDPGGRQAFGELAAAPLLRPFDLDVAEVRLAFRVGVQVVDTHAYSLMLIYVLGNRDS